MSQHYAFFSDDQAFELFEAPESREAKPQEARFALTPDSELARRPAHHKLRERLQGKARPEKRRYFAQETEASKGASAERLLSRARSIETKLLQKHGEKKS